MESCVRCLLGIEAKADRSHGASALAERVSAVFLTAGAVEWSKSRSHCVRLLALVRPALRNGTGAAVGKAVESRILWPGKGHEFCGACCDFVGAELMTLAGLALN